MQALRRTKLDEYLQDIDFSGNVSIYKRKYPLYRNSFRYRDLSNGIPNNHGTIFGIASGTKTFTAVGIMKLIESGLAELSTSVGDIFCRDMQFIQSDATIKQLLNHTSGIFDYYDEELITDFDTYTVNIPWCKLESPTDYLRLFEPELIKFKSGTRPSYSNGGYVFLGIIIEKLSGLVYRDFMRETIFEPLRMRSTGFYAFNALPGNVACGYISTGDVPVTNIYQLPIRGGGDGGLYTNSEDMLVFWTELFGNGLISDVHLGEMTNSEVEIFRNQKYGLGVYISEFGEYTSYSARGCDVGVGFASSYIPKTGLNINVFSNMTDGHKGVLNFIEDDCIDLLCL